MRPKLSIITPSFNQGGYIERTIESVLGQDYENLEYLIADGGSTDGSAETIAKYESQLAWWVSEPDGGQTDALNKALAKCTGDVVAYINSDDYYLPGAFDKAIDALETTGLPWMAGASRFEDEHEGLVEVWIPQPASAAEMPLLPGRQGWVLAPWSVPQPSSFWRRSVFDQLGGFRSDMHFAFDTEFFLRLAYAGLEPALIDDELAVRYLHDEAKSADLVPFRREMKQLISIVRPTLTRGERVKLAVTRGLIAVRFFRALNAARSLVLRGSQRLPDAVRPSKRPRGPR